MSVLATALINWSALWKIVVAAMVGGIGVVLAFGVLLLGLARAQSADGAARRVGFYTLSVVCGVLCVAAVALGIYAMAKKPVSKPPTTRTAAATIAG